MKFHHLGQLLLDSNCILLVLKMFGMQEVSSVIVAKNEIPDCKYVHHFSIPYLARALTPLHLQLLPLLQPQLLTQCIV